MKMRPLADITKCPQGLAGTGNGEVLSSFQLCKVKAMSGLLASETTCPSSYSGAVLWGFSTLITEQIHLIPWARV